MYELQKYEVNSSMSKIRLAFIRTFSGLKYTKFEAKNSYPPVTPVMQKFCRINFSFGMIQYSRESEWCKIRQKVLFWLKQG